FPAPHFAPAFLLREMTMRPSSRFARLAALGLGLALAVPAFAGARDELNRFTGGLKGLEGSFEQQVFDANGRSKERSSGIVAVSAPRLFRWEYKKPFAQLIVADGQKDRKSTRLNSSHVKISYAVFCLKKKNNTIEI